LRPAPGPRYPAPARATHVIFLTYWFVIFGGTALPLFWLATRPRLRLLLLVGSCAAFHTHFAGPAGVLPILVLGAVTYLIGLTQDRRLCRLGIVLVVLGLVFYVAF
jgi:alginate O-acetyltransferase complex protein AlgI